MDAALDRYLTQMDVEPGDDDEHYGWYKAEMGEAWTVNAGIGIREDGAVRLATIHEAAGAQAYWKSAGIVG